MPEEFLDCLIDTSIKSSATHEAAFLNPTFPWDFISIWDFSPSCSVSYDFHAEGSHGLFLKQQNKQLKAATQGKTQHRDIKTACTFPPNTHHWRRDIEGWNNNKERIIKLGEKTLTLSLFITYTVEKCLLPTPKFPLMTFG